MCSSYSLRSVFNCGLLKFFWHGMERNIQEPPRLHTVALQLPQLLDRLVSSLSVKDKGLVSMHDTVNVVLCFVAPVDTGSCILKNFNYYLRYIAPVCEE